MDLANPALTVGLAIGAGVLAQVLARHARIPGIVLLLLTGVLLGPDVAGLVRPDTLAGALRVLVGFAVAVILFDGGMSLDLVRIRKEAKPIRRLVTLGAVIMAAGGALAARWLLGWDWRLSILFGTLVIVTGPTVVTPLVRRLRLKEPVQTILIAEGVLIDPVGAIIAVVTLELLYAEGGSLLGEFGAAAGVLGFGALFGGAAGGLIALILRARRLVPPGLENILVLSLVVALFQIAELLRPESGLATVVAAGMVVGNIETRVHRELLDFKEQLTILLIGLLFVLLAADVRLAEVVALGWPGLATVGALMLIVRPVQVWLCTLGSRLRWQERLFLASMAPRGIVAAAVASLFAQQLLDRGVPEGAQLRALVFLVIAITVTVHGLTGGLISRVLDLRRPVRAGYAFLGANALARALARELERDGSQVVLVDSNVDRTEEAQSEGFRVLHGQGLLADVIDAVDPESRVGCVALTPNEEVNLLFAQRVREEARLTSLWVALSHESGGIPVEAVHQVGAAVLFGRPRNLDAWIGRAENGGLSVEAWTRSTARPADPPLHLRTDLLILAVRKRGRLVPFDDHVTLGGKEEIVVALHEEARADAEQALREHGFESGPRVKVARG